MSPSSFQEFYSKHANGMDARWKDFIAVQADWLLNRLKIIFPQEAFFTVIDLGCGTGEILSQIADIFPNAELYGVDGTAAMVDIASKKLQGRARIEQADLENYIPDEGYDVVISTTVLHHLHSPMDHMKKLHSLLNNDGHLFLSEIAIVTLRLYLAQIWWSFTQKSHYYSWNENDFRYFIKSCDYEIINGVILSPDNFWRLQMYHLQSNQP